ncbi:MAG TPA: hypothetical protein VHM20_03100 [Gammaproteobacteria bacterium]|jgi:hypothetical protein|nr:hypothetical protein [Gammaproteobacteria bacterium]
MRTREILADLCKQLNPSIGSVVNELADQIDNDRDSEVINHQQHLSLKIDLFRFLQNFGQNPTHENINNDFDKVINSFSYNAEIRSKCTQLSIAIMLSQFPQYLANKETIETPIKKLMKQIEGDAARGHIDDKQYTAARNNLLHLLGAVSQCNTTEINYYYNKLRNSCKYHPKAYSKWTMLGLAIGAFLEAAAVAAVTFFTKGAALPLWAFAFSGGTGFIGSLFGHKIGEYSTKRKIDHLKEAIDNIPTIKLKLSSSVKSFSIFPCRRKTDDLNEDFVPSNAPLLK